MNQHKVWGGTGNLFTSTVVQIVLSATCFLVLELMFLCIVYP